MKKFQSAETTLVKSQTINKAPQEKKNNLIELLPQIIKILPQVENLFKKSTPNKVEVQNTQQQNYNSAFFKNKNKQAALLSIEQHKKLVDKIKGHNP